MLRAFEPHQPASAEAAPQLGEDRAFYTGGTELLLVMKEGLLRYTHVIDGGRLLNGSLVEYRWIRSNRNAGPFVSEARRTCAAISNSGLTSRSVGACRRRGAA